MVSADGSECAQVPGGLWGREGKTEHVWPGSEKGALENKPKQGSVAPFEGMPAKSHLNHF